MRESCSPNCDIVHLCIFFHVFVVWDRSKTHFLAYIFCRSGRECLWTQWIYGVLLVRDRPSFRHRLCLAQGVQCCPNFHLDISLSIEWEVWWPEGICKERLETSMLFWEFVTWSHISLFLQKWKIFSFVWCIRQIVLLCLFNLKIDSDNKNFVIHFLKR